MLKDSSGLRISNSVILPTSEIELSAIRSQGAGGQNVNKVSTGIHLRFIIASSSLPDSYKEQLLKLCDHHITGDGVVIIKAQRYRSQEKNREDALARLRDLIRRASIVAKKRRPTKPTRSSQKRRLESKNKRSQTKTLRKKIAD